MFKKKTKKSEKQEIVVVKKRKLNKWFDAGTWIDADGIRQNYSALGAAITSLKNIFKSNKTNESGETFEDFAQMMQRLSLDERAINTRIRWFYYTSLIYIAMTCITLAYVVHLWIHGGFLLGFPSLSFVFFLGAMACRERIRYYQMKNRITSCDFKQWWQAFRQGKG